MTASGKKKRERKQDFAKTKLKVGKTKAKPANFTNTSFKSKALVLATQSLNQAAPTQAHLLNNHLSLLTHHSSTTRRESLAYLTTHLPPTFGAEVSAHHTIPAAALIPALSPVILDSSSSVRTQLLTLMQHLPPKQIELYVPKIMLYINSAMTHITPDIRADSTKFLGWLLTVNADSLLRNGGWAKGLWGLIGVLGWGTAKDKNIVLGNASMGIGGGSTEKGSKGKITTQHLEVLGNFLRCGLHEQEETMPGEALNEDTREASKAYWTPHLHMIPSKPNQSNTYSYLGLFSHAQVNMDGSGSGTGGVEDIDARRRWLSEGAGKDAYECMNKGLRGVIQEGGEIGRLGGRVLGVLDTGLSLGAENRNNPPH